MQLASIDKLKTLGEGTYGKCYLVSLNNETKTIAHNASTASESQTGDLCVLKQI